MENRPEDTARCHLCRSRPVGVSAVGFAGLGTCVGVEGESEGDEGLTGRGPGEGVPGRAGSHGGRTAGFDDVQPMAD